MRLLVTCLILIMASSASAAEKALLNGVAVDGLVRAYEKTARALDISRDAFRMTRRNCVTEAMTSCRYLVNGNVSMLAGAEGPKEDASQVWIIVGNDTEPVHLLMATAMTIAVFEPELSVEARNGIVGEIIGSLGKEGEKTVNSADLRYSVTVSPPIMSTVLVTAR